MKARFFDTAPDGAHPKIIKFLLDNNLDHFIDLKEDKVAALKQFLDGSLQ